MHLLGLWLEREQKWPSLPFILTTLVFINMQLCLLWICLMDFYLSLLCSGQLNLDNLTSYTSSTKLYLQTSMFFTWTCVRLTLENGSNLSGSPAAAALEAAAASCSAPSVMECDTCWPPSCFRGWEDADEKIDKQKRGRSAYRITTT